MEDKSHVSFCVLTASGWKLISPLCVPKWGGLTKNVKPSNAVLKVSPQLFVPRNRYQGFRISS